MAINKLKVMLSFMRELNDGNIPNENDYGLELEQFADIIEACQDEGLIKGANIKIYMGGMINCNLQRVKLTVKGMEYINENSASMKTYKGLKKIKEWIPFL